MANQNDSGGLTDRRSLRELVDQSIGGKDAPTRNPGALLRNTRKKRDLMQREEKRLDKELAKKRKKKEKTPVKPSEGIVMESMKDEINKLRGK